MHGERQFSTDTVCVYEYNSEKNFAELASYQISKALFKHSYHCRRDEIAILCVQHSRVGNVPPLCLQYGPVIIIHNYICTHLM